MSDYYNQNAKVFYESTVDIDMSPLYERFLPLLSGKRILDAGCGSGRDSKAFEILGYDVTAFDSSSALVNLARSNASRVHYMSFADMDWTEEFDGVWACASLLHLPYRELSKVLARIAEALKSEGVLYCSFKYGDTERVKDGRFFADLNERLFLQFIDGVPALDLLSIWVSDDQRSNRDERWLNCLCRKRVFTSTD